MLEKAISLIRMTESLKFALEKGWYDRALLLANGIQKIAELLETEIGNTHLSIQSVRMSQELLTLYKTST